MVRAVRSELAPWLPDCHATATATRSRDRPARVAACRRLNGVDGSSAIELAAWKHASARFGSPAPRSGSVRRGRMVRCRRSRVLASTTWVPDRVGCSVFLNNRYYDPTLGAFTSVDPLVGKTGTPYLYGNGNPSTLSDPTGLAACSDDNQCPWSSWLESCAQECGYHYDPPKPLSREEIEALYLSSTVEFTPQSPTRQLSEATAEQILEQGQDLSKAGESGRLAVGGCFSASWVFGSFDGCIVATNVDIGTTSTVSAGSFSDSASLTAGMIVSNAQSLEELAGPTACVSSSGGFGGGGNGTVCASLDPETSLPTGVMTVYVGVGVTTPGVTLTYGVTEVNAWSSTPFFVRWILPGFGGDDTPYVSHWGDDPLQENFQGRWSNGSAQTCFYTAGIPC